MVSGEPEGPWLNLAGRVRSEIQIPVVGVGRIKRPEFAEEAIRNNLVDFAAIGRGSITDPDFPKKAHVAGYATSCTSCNLCLGRKARPGMICPINPFVGREVMLANLKRDRSRRIVIHGGGFAALTAAWLAASRGHAVSVVEEEGDYGGMQGWRSHVPGQAEYADAVKAIIGRARLAGVTFSSTSEYEEEDMDIVWSVRRFEPAARLKIDGKHHLTSFDVLRDSERELPERILVIGDDLSAADAALVLAGKGHAVVLRSPSADIAFDAHPGFRTVNRDLLRSYGATVETLIPFEKLHTDIDFDAMVVGRIPDRLGNKNESSTSWNGDVQAAVLEDAYEPSALVKCVYRGVDLVLGALDGSTIQVSELTRSLGQLR